MNHSAPDNQDRDLMRKAIEASMAGQRAAAGAIAPGVREGAVDGVVYAAFRGQGSFRGD